MSKEANIPSLVDGRPVTVPELENHDLEYAEHLAEHGPTPADRAEGLKEQVAAELFDYAQPDVREPDGQPFIDALERIERDNAHFATEAQALRDQYRGKTLGLKLDALDAKREKQHREQMRGLQDTYRKSVKPFKADLPLTGPVASTLSIWGDVVKHSTPDFAIDFATQLAREGHPASFFVRNQLERFDSGKAPNHWTQEEVKPLLRAYLRIPQIDPLSVQQHAESFFRTQFEFVAARATASMRALARRTGE